MKNPVVYPLSAAGLTALLVAGALAPRPAPAQNLSGLDLFKSHCDGCHELPDPEDPKRTKAEWTAIVGKMVKEKGATLSPAEQKAVVSYLDSFNREVREIQWKEGPARSHKAELRPADAGKLPSGWVDLTLGGDSQVEWAVRTDAAAKTPYLAPGSGAGENEFPTLIDNSGTLQNGVVSTRFQMVSGKPAPVVGLLVGFKNPQNYFGVRITPTSAVLYEVQRGQRAILSRPAALQLAPKQWHTAAVEVAGKELKVSVNGKSVPQLTRTLEGYTGGRVGVNTQGETVAHFDAWEVVVK